MKPSPSAPSEILSGHAAVGENHFRGVAGAQAELVFFLAGLESGRSLFDDEGADAVRAFGFVGHRHHHGNVGIVAVGGEGLRAVDDPVIAVALRGGARAAGVGAGFGLGQRPRADFFALGERRQIFLLLRFGAEFEDVIAAERIVRRDDDADRAVDAREFLDRSGVFDVAEAGAAVFFGKDDAEQAHFGELGHDFGWKVRGFVPLHDVRGDFAFGEFADAAAQLLSVRR